jgi:hypothetical protein
MVKTNAGRSMQAIARSIMRMLLFHSVWRSCTNSHGSQSRSLHGPFIVCSPAYVDVCCRLQLPLKYIAIFVVSMMFPALDSITKEKVGSLWCCLACICSQVWFRGATGCTVVVVQPTAPRHSAPGAAVHACSLPEVSLLCFHEQACVCVSLTACPSNVIVAVQVFTESKERLNGQDLDIFVVNRFVYLALEVDPSIHDRPACGACVRSAPVHTILAMCRREPTCARLACVCAAHLLDSEDLCPVLMDDHLPCCSFASGFQALSVALMLPGIASLRGIGWQNLPGYLVEGVLDGTPVSSLVTGSNACVCSPLSPLARPVQHSQHCSSRSHLAKNDADLQEAGDRRYDRNNRVPLCNAQAQRCLWVPMATAPPCCRSCTWPPTWRSTSARCSSCAPAVGAVRWDPVLLVVARNFPLTPRCVGTFMLLQHAAVGSATVASMRPLIHAVTQCLPAFFRCMC